MPDLKQEGTETIAAWCWQHEQNDHRFLSWRRRLEQQQKTGGFVELTFGAPSLYVAEWNMEDHLGRKLVLTEGKYRCPKCGKMSLRFSWGGLCWN